MLLISTGFDKRLQLVVFSQLNYYNIGVGKHCYFNEYRIMNLMYTQYHPSILYRPISIQRT